jgi:hypothetical protein
MKKERSVYVFLMFLTGILMAVSGCLFSQNLDYRSVNRELILQNDSLMSVLIDMNRKIDKPDAYKLSDKE